MVFQILNAVAAVAALAFSGWSLYRQRALPRMEAQMLWNVEGVAGVAVRNTGRSSAKAPWFLLATGSYNVVGQVNNGFLGVEESILAQTEVPTESLQKGVSRGVVGCMDSNGKYLAWSFDGGRMKRRKKTTFEEAFRLFHPDIELGEQVGISRQRKL